MQSGMKVLAFSLLVACALVVLMARLASAPSPAPEGTGLGKAEQGGSGERVFLYCAAGLRFAVGEVVKRYEQEYGRKVEVQYGGSGQLEGALRLSKTGDLFLPAESIYLDRLGGAGLARERIPVAIQRPLLAVRKGNPLGIRTFEDLLQPRVKVALANPDQAAIGQLVRRALRENGRWEALKKAVEARGVFKPTVPDTANDVKMNAMDAAILWDATVGQYPELEGLELPEFKGLEGAVEVAVLESSRQPAVALHFARYLSARDRGLEAFRRQHFQVVVGDLWADRPELVLFSGGVNRLAIEETLKEFERREGVSIAPSYNGCGILVGQMKGGARPDAYLACDVSFMRQVQNRFEPSLTLSETDVVIIVRKGNPHQIGSLKELGEKEILLGVANPGQSALGALTVTLLKELGLYTSVYARVKVQSPTADMLVNQLLAGGLDAAIVYTANLSKVRDKLEVVRVDHPLAKALQPAAVAQGSGNAQLAHRLILALQSAQSLERYRRAGFRVLFQTPPATLPALENAAPATLSERDQKPSGNHLGR